MTDAPCFHGKLNIYGIVCNHVTHMDKHDTNTACVPIIATGKRICQFAIFIVIHTIDVRFSCCMINMNVYQIHLILFH